jgi:hypothetical protein
MLVVGRIIKPFLLIVPKPSFCVFSGNSGVLERTMETTNEGDGRIGLLEDESAGRLGMQRNVQYLPSPTKSQNDKKEYR